MNREQRRTLEKKARKHGASREDAKKYVDIMNRADAIRANGVGTFTPAKEISEGSKVKMNTEAIKGRKNYANMAEEYKSFVESNEGTLFTAHVEKPKMISFLEEPRWLFWSGDLETTEESA